MIRIFDADTNFDDFVQDDSQGFLVKGRLTITQPASVASGLDCGSLQTIEWQRDGRINAVNVKYSINGGSTYPNTIQGDRTFENDSATTQTTSSQWSVPETPMVTTYRLLVEDTEYEKDGTAGTFIETANFRVNGELALTAPVDTTIWRILEQKTISWNVLHGNMGKVKIMASPLGDFSDAYSIASAGTIDAFSAGDPFDVGKLPAKVGSGSYLWTIPVTTDLVDTMKFKIVQEDAGFTDIESNNQSAAIEIRPSITVQTPGSDWTEGATNKSITFTVNGTDLSTVYVFLYDPDDAVEHRLDTSGVTTTGSGNPQTWGPSTFTVPDAKSLSCTIRVRDAVLAGSAEVEGESGTFKCYPVISGAAITPTPPHSKPNVWVAESTNQTVTWSVNGSNQIEKVDIWYVKSGDSDLSLASDVATSESCATITVPSVRATGVTVRVEDDATAFKTYVLDSTDPFSVYGKVTVTLPDSDSTYIVGSTTDLVKWDYDGNISDVDIFVDYDYEQGSPSWTLLATVAATLGATGWTWEDPGNLPDPPNEGVGDHVGNLIKVKVTDHDYPEDNKTYAVLSDTFSIVGGFTFLAP